jgi:D-alanine-D-alanine ligase
MKVIVLAGGTSTERVVSLTSASCVAAALRKAGHKVTVIDPGTGWTVIDPSDAPEKTSQKSCGLPGKRSAKLLTGSDIVFNTLHGGQGEDGTLNAVLELLDIPYVGSGPGPSAAAMNKVVSKRLFSSVGVPTPPYLVLECGDEADWPALLDAAAVQIGFPAVIKPADQGSTVGLSKASTGEKLMEAVKKAAEYSQQILVEKFIEGRELTVGVVAGIPMPVLEVVVPGGFYDFEAKYHSHSNKYICPAQIPGRVAQEAQRLALEAFNVLGLADYARIDFRLDLGFGLWCLEANNQPGMTDSSLLPKAAGVLGFDLSDLLEKLLHSALARYGVRAVK